MEGYGTTMTTDTDTDTGSDGEFLEQHVRAGSAASGPYVLDIEPRRAGWLHSALRVLDLPPGGTHTLNSGDSEWIVLPLSGGCTVHTQGEIFELLGRESVFSSVTDFAYVPRDAHAQIASGAGAASPWQERSASDDSPLATAPHRRFRSNCGAAATAPARSTTSPPRTPSTATG